MRTNKPTWIEFGLALMDFDEVLLLAEHMHITRVEAAGYIALVVAFGIARADDDGQVDHLTDKAIEDACCWEGERGQLVEAFCETGIFRGNRDDDEFPLTISPVLWVELAGGAIKRRADSRERQRAKRKRDKA